MARALRIPYPKAFYHVTCRGNERKDIFRDDRDRGMFLKKLQTSLDIYEIRLHAYVLMKNHFHLIIETPKANLSEFMRHFNISYTGYFNYRHHRVGHLYQGRFKAILVEADAYLLEVSRYVHLNPIRIQSKREEGIKENLKAVEDYPWSSLKGYLYRRKKMSWVIYDKILEYVQRSQRRYREYIEEGLRKGVSTPWEEIQGQVVLGGEEFWEEMKGRIKRRGGDEREQPSLRIVEKEDSGGILNEVARVFKTEREKLEKKWTRKRDERGMGMEALYRHSGLSQREIGRRMGGIDYSTVSRERNRIREKMEDDPRMRRKFEEIEFRLRKYQ